MQTKARCQENSGSQRGLVLALLAGVAQTVSAVSWSPTGDGLTNELSVAKGETYTLTEADATRLGATCLHLTGEGTVVGTKAFMGFTGDVRISNGIFQLTELGGLGDTSTVRRASSLVIDGGTLQNGVRRPNDWSQRDITSVPVKMVVYLSGTGYAGRGAIESRVRTENFARTICLAGDTTIASANWQELQFRYCYLNEQAEGRTLTVTNATWLGFVKQWGGNAKSWNLDIHGGGLFLSDTTLPFADSTIHLKDGQLKLYNFGGDENSATAQAPFGPDFKASLVFSGDSLLSIASGTPQIAAKGESLRTDRNRFAGSVTLNGPLGVGFTNDPTLDLGVAFDGVVSGAGGFVPRTDASERAGWLRLSNKDNSFDGGVSVSGLPVVSDGTFRGGLSLLASGAAPANGGPITLTNATLQLNNSLHGEQAYELPALVVTDGGHVQDNLKVKDALTSKGLTKTGDGVLTLASPLAFTSVADVKGGTLKLVPDGSAVRGLKLWWRDTNANGVSDVQQDDYYQGLDEYASWAYRDWKNYGSGPNDDPSYKQGYYYEGFICIPGDEGKDVTFNFITQITRKVRVTIDETVVADVNDDKNILARDGGVYVGSWSRLGIAPQRTMKAGWHRLTIWMGNTWNNQCGPTGYTEGGVEIWPSKFGIGVDWQGRCTTNKADYAKLEDPGDGSFLRWTNDVSRCRASFAGGVAFAAGTVFDLGDASGEAGTLEVPSLAGAPTVTNGALHVKSDTWTLRAGDVVPGLPLTVATGSSLGFGEAGSEVTVDVTPEACASLRGKGGRIRILAWAGAAERPDNAFVASAALQEALWSVSTADDGVYLVKPRFMMIIR